MTVLDPLIDQMRANNLRVTQCRVNMLKVFAKEGGPLSAKDMFCKLSNRPKFKADLASIYRNLTLFEQLGFVHQISDGSYRLCSNKQGPCLLITCSQCGSSEDIQLDAAMKNHVLALKRSQKGLENVSHLEFKGICGLCSEAAPQ